MHVVVACSFSLLCNIPLWEHATLYIYVILSLGILVVSSFSDLNCFDTHSSLYMFSGALEFFKGIYTRVKFYVQKIYTSLKFTR